MINFRFIELTGLAVASQAVSLLGRSYQLGLLGTILYSVKCGVTCSPAAKTRRELTFSFLCKASLCIKSKFLAFIKSQIAVLSTTSHTTTFGFLGSVNMPLTRKSISAVTVWPVIL